MFNFNNLNIYEFEVLCKDIMSRRLGISLRTFAEGPDGGIDITDDAKETNIIIQCKRTTSNFSNLRASLKNELSKVEKLKPREYYILTSLPLTPNNIRELYDMFSDYMESSNNVIDGKLIDEILREKII